MKPMRTQLLTEELIALDSVTPHDKGCQERLKELLAPLGFSCETIESNGVTNLWARKGTTWRNLSDERKAQVVDKASALELMLENPSVIKRPVLQGVGPVSVGFSPDAYAAKFRDAA